MPNSDRRLIELLQELRLWVAGLEYPGDYTSLRPSIPALRLLADVYPVTPYPEVDGEDASNRFYDRLQLCVDYDGPDLESSCAMWIHHLKGQV